MERRRHPRISATRDARFFHGNLFYSGQVLDVSHKGMFIRTKRLLPAGTICAVLLRIDNQLLKMIARVKRNIRNNRGVEGIGVEMLSTSAVYMGLICELQKNT